MVNSNGKRNIFLYIATPVFLAFAIVYGVKYYRAMKHYVSTDDAFIDGHIVRISPKITGTVQKVYVRENHRAKKGELLLELDASDYNIQLDEAKAALQSAVSRRKEAQLSASLVKTLNNAEIQQASSGVFMENAGVAETQAQMALAEQKLKQAEAKLNVAKAQSEQAESNAEVAKTEKDLAENDLGRYQKLYEKEEISKQQMAHAGAALKTAEAKLQAAFKIVAASKAAMEQAQTEKQMAKEELNQVKAKIEGAKAKVGKAEGALEATKAAPQKEALSEAGVDTSGSEVQRAEALFKKAKLELSYTKIYAPVSGVVTKKAVEEGMLVQAGQPLMAIVSDEIWVVANFKETQIKKIRPGQTVDIEVDVEPGKIFKGHVDSIMKGSGARFSLLPPENATGNFIKIVQRVPVKIVFDKPPDMKIPLGPGMSVVPRVKIR